MKRFIFEGTWKKWQILQIVPIHFRGGVERNQLRHNFINVNIGSLLHVLLQEKSLQLIYTFFFLKVTNLRTRLI